MSTQNIQVFVRCRPSEDINGTDRIDISPDEKEIRVNDKEFVFDKVFGPECRQQEIYRDVVKPMIDQVVCGFNCTIFAYGPTGTGKTYTMEGQESETGIIPRSICQLIDILSSKETQSSLKVSFMELYNEDTYDLLSPIEDTTKLRIFDDANKKGSIIVGGLGEVEVNSKEEIFEILKRGSQKRQTAVTLLNACSSRSHTIFTITVSFKETVGKLNLVDLAGSESIGRSGAQDKRAREAGSINQSLLTLNRVITAIVEKRPHVPYRESKLTRILQDSLGGSTRTSIIATISTSDGDLSNTYSTLDYASRARAVVNRPELNHYVKKNLTDLNKEIQILMEKHSNEMCDMEIRVRNEVALEFKREMDKMKQNYKLQNQAELEATKETYELQLKTASESADEMQKQLDETNGKLKNFEDENLQLKEQIKKLSYDLKHTQSLADYRATFANDLEKELKVSNIEREELKLKIKELNQIIERSTSEMEMAEVKKAARIRKAPVLEECSEYANMTFDGGDEITQISAKKSRKKVVAGVKRRAINEAIPLSGKKKKLTNGDMEHELSPVPQPPTSRVTRSRATRRKLDF